MLKYFLHELKYALLNHKITILVCLFQLFVIATLIYIVFTCNTGNTPDTSSKIGNDEAPTLYSSYMTNPNTLVLTFSFPTTIENIYLSPSIEVTNVETKEGENGENVFYVYITFEKGIYTIGEKYELQCNITTRKGKSVDLLVPFYGFNKNKCNMLLTKVQPKYYGGGTDEENFVFEYVEVTALEDGNVSGLEVYSASDGEGKSYVFPSINVTKGERIIVHLRYNDKGCVNELEDDLNLSTASCAFYGIRDLWDFANEQNARKSTRLSDRQDVIVLRWSDTKEVLDIVPYALPTVKNWSSIKKSKCELIIQNAINYGVWDGDTTINTAINISGCTTRKAIVRTTDTRDASAWKVMKVDNNADEVVPLEVTPNSNKENNSDVDSTESNNSDSTQNENTDNIIDDKYSDNNETHNITSSDLTQEVDKELEGEFFVTYISKIQPLYEDGKNNDGHSVYEYVEIQTIDDVNLHGLSLLTISMGEDYKYNFPNINVKSGDKIVVHFQKGKGCIDELGDNLNLSTSYSSFTNERDLWIEKEDNPTSYLDDDADIVLLKWSNRNNTLEDLVPYAKSTVKKWRNNDFVESIVTALQYGYWAGGSEPQDAVNADNCTLTNPLSKVYPENDGNSWSALKVISNTSSNTNNTTNNNTTSTNKPTTSTSTNKPNTNTSTSTSSSNSNKDNEKVNYTLSTRTGINAELTEVQPTYTGAGGVFKDEYIELYIIKGGNLSDLKLNCIKKSTSKICTLPNVTVKDGEIIVVHLCCRDNTCISELGDNLNLSTAYYSAENARDIWLTNINKKGNVNTDILDNNLGGILLLDKNDGVMDFVGYIREGTDKNIQSNELKEAIKFAVNNNLWGKSAVSTNEINGSYLAGIGSKSAKKPLVKISEDKKGVYAWTYAPEGTPGYF